MTEKEQAYTDRMLKHLHSEIEILKNLLQSEKEESAHLRKLIELKDEALKEAEKIAELKLKNLQQDNENLSLLAS
jgi:hypothetical protein